MFSACDRYSETNLHRNLTTTCIWSWPAVVPIWCLSWYLWAPVLSLNVPISSHKVSCLFGIIHINYCYKHLSPELSVYSFFCRINIVVDYFSCRKDYFCWFVGQQYWYLTTIMSHLGSCSHFHKVKWRISLQLSGPDASCSFLKIWTSACVLHAVLSGLFPVAIVVNLNHIYLCLLYMDFELGHFILCLSSSFVSIQQTIVTLSRLLKKT